MRSREATALPTVLIHSGTLVCMDESWTVARGDLVMRDAAIAAVGPGAVRALDGAAPDVTVDATGAFVIPGLIQGHVHLCQTLFRGLAEQAELLRWLRESIWPLEAAHTAASLAASARLGLLELLAAGVTTINDMGTARHTETLGEVLESSGVRALFGKALMDSGVGVPPAMIDAADTAFAECRALARRFHGAGDGRLHVTLAPRFILSCSEPLWDGVAAIAAETGQIVHTHIAEGPGEGREVEQAVGRTAARFFAGRGVLGPGFVGAHGVWLEDDELALVRERGAALVTCPGANLKLGSGIARTGAWVKAGIRRGIGSDGPPCNNRLDPFHELSLAALLARVRDRDNPLGARDALALATCEGARALGLGAVTGRLVEGLAADVAVIDHRGPHVGPDPEADPYTTLVHAARASDVRLTLVAGRVLYHDGRWATLEPERIRREAEAERRELLQRVERAA
jgi:5-methylthioadenosine/S-adenosylhomocysteine deaminase